jgi:hypothetical protein
LVVKFHQAVDDLGGYCDAATAVVDGVQANFVALKANQAQQSPRPIHLEPTPTARHAAIT